MGAIVARADSGTSLAAAGFLVGDSSAGGREKTAVLTGVALVLGGSLAHAAWNVLVKAGADGGKVYVLAYSLCVLALAAVAFAVRAALGVTVELDGAVVACGLVSAAFHTTYALALRRAYGRADLSLVYPVARGVGPLVAVLFGLIVLGEGFGLWQWLGTALVLGGIALCSRPGTTDRAAWGRAAVYGAVVGAAIGAYTVWDDIAVAHAGVDPVSYYFAMVLFQVLLLAVVCRRSIRSELAGAFRRHGLRLWVVGLLVGVSYVSVLYAMRLIPLSVVAPLRGSAIVFGALAAIVWLRERHASQRLVGATVVFGGIALIVTHA